MIKELKTNIFLYVFILVYTFFSFTVATRLGISGRVTVTSLLLFLALIRTAIYTPDRFELASIKQEVWIITIVVVLCMVKYLIQDVPAIERMYLTFISPMLISILLFNSTLTSRKVLRALILLFFLVECLLAIYERVSSINVFPYIDEDTIENLADLQFRSTAILGHPLLNALVVSIIMVSVMISDSKLMIKGWVYTLGLVAILCFNARAATLIWVLLSLITTFYLLRSKRGRSRTKLIVIAFVICVAIGVGYLILVEGFADRLVNNNANGGLYDSSAKARIDVFAAFDYVKDRDLIFGQSAYYLMITDKLGQAGVENSYIVLILYYGVPAFLLFVLSYFFWLSKYLKNLSTLEKCMLFLGFILLGSANNSLVDQAPWMFFVLCANSFLPNSKKYQCRKINRETYVVETESSARLASCNIIVEPFK